MARYFTSDTFDFLQDLEMHNERSWFKDNQDRFEAHVREPMLAFIDDIAEPMQKRISKHLVADPKKAGGSMFRINRDTRFAKDKSPYKTNTGAWFRHERGKEVHAPGLYMHLEPGNYFAGGGIYMPDNEVLAKLRKAIDTKPKAWLAVRDDPTIKRFNTEAHESLKRAPKGYDEDHPLIDDLRRKDFTLGIQFTEKQVTGTKFLDLYLDRAEKMKPTLAWLCGAMGLTF